MASHKARDYFVTGLIVLLPIMLTILTIDFFIRLIDKTVISIFPFLPEWPYDLEVIMVLTGFILLTFLIGLIVSHLLKNKLQIFLDKIFLNIPVIKSLYSGTKRVTDAMLSNSEKKAFKRVVLVPFPNESVYSLGFVTQEESKFNKGHVTIFVPQAPLPHNGYIIMVKKSLVKDLDMSVNEAIRMILSGGIIDSDKTEPIKNL